MPTSFPIVIGPFTVGSNTDPLSSPNHPQQHQLINAALGAINDQLGTDLSAMDALIDALTTAVAARLVAANDLSDLASVPAARTNLGLGTAAVEDTGTSGATVPLCNGANTWAAAQTLQAPTTYQNTAAPSTPAASSGSLYAETHQGHTHLHWMDEDGTVYTVCRDNAFLIRNTSGGDMTKGQVVNITGSTGQVPTVSLADADTFGLHAEGILLENVANNAFGMAMATGELRNVNTQGLSEGGKIYLSSTPGAYTQSAPAAPATYQELGTIINAHSSQGVILINVQTALRQ